MTQSPYRQRWLAKRHRVIQPNARSSGFLYRYHPKSQLRAVQRFGLESYNPVQVNIDRRDRGEDMSGWPEAEEETWPDGSQADRIYFTPKRWGQAYLKKHQDRVEIRIPIDVIRHYGGEIYEDECLPPDVFVEGSISIRPQHIQVNQNGKWVNLAMIQTNVRSRASGLKELIDTAHEIVEKHLERIGIYDGFRIRIQATSNMRWIAQYSRESQFRNVGTTFYINKNFIQIVEAIDRDVGLKPDPLRALVDTLEHEYGHVMAEYLKYEHRAWWLSRKAWGDLIRRENEEKFAEEFKDAVSSSSMGGPMKEVVQKFILVCGVGKP